MGTILKARIQQKYEIKEKWDLLNPGDFIPLKGEVCYTTINDQLYTKIGDGTTDFTDLPWLVNQADWYETDENAPGYIKNKICEVKTEEVNQPFYNIDLHNQGQNQEWDSFNDWVISEIAIEPSEVQALAKTNAIYNLEFDGLAADYLGPKVFNFEFNECKIDGLYNAYYTGNKNTLLDLVNETDWSVELPEKWENDDAPYTIIVLDTEFEGEDDVRYVIYFAVSISYFSPNRLAEYLNPSIVLEKTYETEKINDLFFPNFTSDYLETNCNAKSYIKHKHGVLNEGILENPITILPETTCTARATYMGIYAWDTDLDETYDFLSNLPEELTYQMNKLPITIVVDGIKYSSHINMININDFKTDQGIINTVEGTQGLYIGNFQELLITLGSSNIFSGVTGDSTDDEDVPYAMMLGYSAGKLSLTVMSSKSKHPFYFTSSQEKVLKRKVSIYIDRLPWITSPITPADIAGLPLPVGELNEYHNSVLFNYSYKANGDGSIAAGIGTKTESEAHNSLAAGHYNIIEKPNSFSIGDMNIINGKNSIVSGQRQAVGVSCGAFGTNTKTPSSAITITRKYNDNYNAIHYYTILGNQVEYINQFDYLVFPSLDNPEYILKICKPSNSFNTYIAKYDSSTDLTTFCADGYEEKKQGESFEAYLTHYNNVADYSIVSGENNQVKNIHSAVFGIGNDTKTNGSLIAGQYANTKLNTIFAIGNGSEFASSNAIEVDYDGNIIGQDLVIRGETINDNYFYRANLVWPNRNTTIKLNQKDSVEIRNKNLFKTDFVESEYITHNLDGSLTALDGGRTSTYSTTILLPPGTYVISNGMTGGNSNFYISVLVGYSLAASTQSLNQDTFTLSKLSQITCRVYYYPGYEEGVENITIYPQLELTSTGIPSDFVKPKVEIIDSNENNECIINLINWDNSTSVVATKSNTILNLEQSNLSIKQNLIPELESRISILEEKIQTLLNNGV